MRVIRTSKAKQDIIEIWNHIAVDNRGAADQLVDQIDSLLASISKFPLFAKEVPHIKEGVRCISAKRYRIYYRVIGQNIELLRVLHERRQQWID